MDRVDVRVYGSGKERKEFIVVEYLTSDTEVRYVMVGEVRDGVGKDAGQKRI